MEGKIVAPLDLMQGTVDILVLKALSWGPRHGYAISGWIRERTGGVLTLQDAVLYKSLHRLEERRLLDAEWRPSENNRRAKYYQLTTSGRTALKHEHATWRAYATAVFDVLDANTAGI